MNPSATAKGRQINCGVVSLIDLAPGNPDHFKITISSEYISQNAVPGQFIHVKPPDSGEMLRRPFSIHSVATETNDFTVIFRVIGEGTRLLTGVRPGDVLDIIGPLGNGYSVSGDHPVIITGGGVGIPPLVLLSKKFLEAGLSPGSEIRICIGARDTATLVCEDDFRDMGIEPVIATEDGSRGIKGFVTHAMDQLENIEPGTVVYSCGPVPMLHAVKKWAETRNLECFVSLENKLGCGIGACLGCSIPVTDENGNISYRRVCCDGPVFDASIVSFEEM